MTTQSRADSAAPAHGPHDEGSPLVEHRSAADKEHLGTSGSREAATNTGCVGPLRIVIEPTASRLKWIARLDGRILCTAASRFVQSARVLLAEGYPDDAVIEMWRPNTKEWALRGRLGVVAATLMGGETAGSVAKNGSPVREKGSGERGGHGG